MKPQRTLEELSEEINDGSEPFSEARARADWPFMMLTTAKWIGSHEKLRRQLETSRSEVAFQKSQVARAKEDLGKQVSRLSHRVAEVSRQHNEALKHNRALQEQIDNLLKQKEAVHS